MVKVSEVWWWGLGGRNDTYSADGLRLDGTLNNHLEGIDGAAVTTLAQLELIAKEDSLERRDFGANVAILILPLVGLGLAVVLAVGGGAVEGFVVECGGLGPTSLSSLRNGLGLGDEIHLRSRGRRSWSVVGGDLGGEFVTTGFHHESELSVDLARVDDVRGQARKGGDVGTMIADGGIHGAELACVCEVDG
jgi:hypothetical protein